MFVCQISQAVLYLVRFRMLLMTLEICNLHLITLNLNSVTLLTILDLVRV